MPKLCAVCGLRGHKSARSAKCEKHLEWVRQNDEKKNKRESRPQSNTLTDEQKSWDAQVQEHDEEDWISDRAPYPVVDPNDKLKGYPIYVPEAARNDPLALLNLLWNKEIWTKLYEGTKKHIKRETTEGVEPPKVQMHEFVQYFANLLVMGVVHFPSYDEYWTKEGSYKASIYNCPFVRDSMTQNKFKLIHKNLDWLEREGIETTDRTLELEQLLNINFQKHWQPSLCVVIDEIMLLFKGRWKYRQHCRGKPHATGLKVFAAADNRFYVYSFFLYRGQSRTILQTVLKLLEPLPRRLSQYLVVADSFYGSLALAKALSLLGFLFVLICQTNRPSFLFSNISLPKDGMVTKWKEEFLLETKILQETSIPIEHRTQETKTMTICATSWADRKNVNFVHNVNILAVVQDPKKERLIPQVAQTYNNDMGAVDVFDAYLHRYMPTLRNSRWIRTAIIDFFYMTLTNAFRIFAVYNQNASWKDFLLRLAGQLRDHANELRDEDERRKKQMYKQNEREAKRRRKGETVFS